MVFGVIRCYVLSGKLGLEEGKPDFRSGGPESWDFNRYSLNSSGDITTAPTTGVAAAWRAMTRCAIALTSAGSILVKVAGLDNYNHV